VHHSIDIRSIRRTRLRAAAPYRSVLATRPSTGSWVTYGLGTESESRRSLWQAGGLMTRSGFLPSGIGVVFRQRSDGKNHSEPAQQEPRPDARRSDMDALLR
jgi:hypothetical protein